MSHNQSLATVQWLVTTAEVNATMGELIETTHIVMWLLIRYMGWLSSNLVSAWQYMWLAQSTLLDKCKLTPSNLLCNLLGLPKEAQQRRPHVSESPPPPMLRCNLSQKITGFCGFAHNLFSCLTVFTREHESLLRIALQHSRFKFYDLASLWHHSFKIYASVFVLPECQRHLDTAKTDDWLLCAQNNEKAIWGMWTCTLWCFIPQKGAP